jgi:hypothetical protein
MRKLLESVGVDCTVHGFRSTFRDWAGETTSFPNHVVEMALAQNIGNAVEATYSRSSASYDRMGDLLRRERVNGLGHDGTGGKGAARQGSSGLLGGRNLYMNSAPSAVGKLRKFRWRLNEIHSDAWPFSIR